jgi:hypothetical protein
MKLLRNIATTAALSLSLFSISAHADYSFNFDGAATGTSANNALINPYTDVSFLSGFVTADLDANGYEILDAYGNTIFGQTHWETYADSNITVSDPASYSNGTVANALDARFDQVFIKFNTAQNLSGFSVQLDGTQYGNPAGSSIIFLDVLGKSLSTVDFQSYANPGALITSGPVNGVSGIVLTSGKLYDNLNIATLAPVPEPESYAMMLAGLGLMGAVSRRRRKNI